MTKEEQHIETTRALVAQQHVQWLQNPITQSIKASADKDMSAMIDFIATRSTDDSITSDKLRLYAAQLQAMRNFHTNVFITDNFLSKVKF